MHPLANLALAHTARITWQFLVEFLDSSRLATIFTGFEFAGLLNLELLQAKVQVTPHTNLAALPLPRAAEWDRLAAKYIRKTCCPLCNKFVLILISK